MSGSLKPKGVEQLLCSNIAVSNKADLAVGRAADLETLVRSIAPDVTLLPPRAHGAVEWAEFIGLAGRSECRHARGACGLCEELQSQISLVSASRHDKRLRVWV